MRSKTGFPDYLQFYKIYHIFKVMWFLIYEGLNVQFRQVVKSFFLKQCVFLLFPTFTFNVGLRENWESHTKTNLHVKNDYLVFFKLIAYISHWDTIKIWPSYGKNSEILLCWNTSLCWNVLSLVYNEYKYYETTSIQHTSLFNILY